MSKLSFRESMLNMLGEFVALKRNPEFRLSPKSSQFIDEAMKTEYERSKIAFDVSFLIKPYFLSSLGFG
jgi:hypothetical protein